ncbi:hypothetical protein [Kitasatospora griseola]|uniref:hypothetical protein n=1 Tax=Kitasatospora griseola TaxID=2064 RepID=UPI0013792CD0|nr:hypothetical protein [Kitasatospora griseola]
MQTIQTPDSGSITARRTLVGMDLEVKDENGDTIATVVVSEREAWTLFRALGVELLA